MWGRDSWRQQGILPNAVKKHALPSLSIHRRALVWQSAPQQHTLFFTSALTGFYLLGSISIFFITINGAEESHKRQGRGWAAYSAVKIFQTFVTVKGSTYLFIHLFGRSCTLAFRCVSLSIQQSGSPDLGYSREPQLLTTIKLTGADVTVLHFHTVQRLRRGHVEGWRIRTTGKKKYAYSWEGGGWGKKASVPGPDWPDTVTTMAHYSHVLFSFLLAWWKVCRLHTRLLFSLKVLCFLNRKNCQSVVRKAVYFALCAFHTTIYVDV